MSFFPNPSKIIRASLEARRARQREEAEEKRKAERIKKALKYQKRDFPPLQSESVVTDTFTSINSANSEAAGPSSLVTFKVSETETRDFSTLTVDSTTASEGTFGFGGKEVPHVPSRADQPKGHEGDLVELDVAGIRARSRAVSEGMKSELSAPDLWLVQDGLGEDQFEINPEDFDSYRHMNEEELDFQYQGQELGFGRVHGQPERIPSHTVFHSERGENDECWGPFKCRQYQISPKLRSKGRQAIFLRRVMGVLSCQFLFCLGWICLVKYVPEMREFVKAHFNYAYLPLGIFVISKILLRSYHSIKKYPRPVLIGISLTRVFCAAYYLGAVTVVADTDILFLTGSILLFSQLFYTISAYFINYHVSSSEILGISAVVNFMLGIALLFPYAIFKADELTMHQLFLETWLPAFSASQVIFMFITFDLKQILTGWRFPVAESDWIFTVLYL